jgi:hypothetical protein
VQSVCHVLKFGKCGVATLILNDEIIDLQKQENCYACTQLTQKAF